MTAKSSESFASSTAALNRGVAVAEVAGPEAGLAAIENLDLRDYHLYHSIRADLLRRIGRDLEAAEAYRAAIALSSNKTERTFLENALRSVAG
jgi:RNA polymerase sigma-70 factor (ECF subfamily)